MAAFLATCAEIPARQTTMPTVLSGDRRVWFLARETDTVTTSLETPMTARVRDDPMVMIRYSNTSMKKASRPPPEMAAAVCNTSPQDPRKPLADVAKDTPMNKIV